MFAPPNPWWAFRTPESLLSGRRHSPTGVSSYPQNTRRGKGWVLTIPSLGGIPRDYEAIVMKRWFTSLRTFSWEEDNLPTHGRPAITRVTSPSPFWLWKVSMSLCHLLCFLDSTHEWNHVVFVFNWLAYFTYHNVLQIHPCCQKGFFFFLKAE